MDSGLLIFLGVLLCGAITGAVIGALLRKWDDENDD